MIDPQPSASRCLGLTEPVALHPTGPSPFRREGLGYSYEPAGTGIRFRVSHIQRESGGLRARVAVESLLPGLPPHIYSARHLLEGTNSLRDLKRALSEITGDTHPLTPLWERLIRALTKAVVDAEEAGEPFEKVGQRVAQPRVLDLVQHLLPAGKPTIIYGPGGVGKGIIAVALGVAVTLGEPVAGLAVQQGEVLYLDWEDDADTLDRRIKSVCAGRAIDPVEFHYRVCRGRLDEQLSEITSYVDSHGITLAVVDSVSLAGGTAGDRGTYEDVALRLMAAVRQMRCTVLLIDHVNDVGRRAEGLAGKAYGSVFKGYVSRNTWEVKKDQETGALLSHVGLYQTKTNHTALLAPIGLCLDFRTEGTVRIVREDVRESPELAAPLTTSYRIDRELARGTRTVAELEDALQGIKKDTIHKTLKRGLEGGRYRKALEALPGSPHGDHWALVTHEYDDVPEAQDAVPF